MTSRTILSCFPARIFRVFLAFDDQFVSLRMPQKHSSFRILTLSCQDESALDVPNFIDLANLVFPTLDLTIPRKCNVSLDCSSVSCARGSEPRTSDNRDMADCLPASNPVARDRGRAAESLSLARNPPGIPHAAYFGSVFLDFLIPLFYLQLYPIWNECIPIQGGFTLYCGY